MAPCPAEEKRWYVLRDLKRPNALHPAYKQLGESEIEVFTPMRWHITIKNGKRERRQVPFIHDLLFAHESKQILDHIITRTDTLQYRYQKGAGYQEPMTVPTADMDRFIKAVQSTAQPQYYLPGEITPAMYGREVHIVGGILDGYEGRLLKVKGSKKKRLIVDLPNLLATAVEVDSDYIQFV